jgi:PAS domain S-box-containing protein
VTTDDTEDMLLRSVALQNAESIRMMRLRAERQAEGTLREQAILLNLTHDAIFVNDMHGILKYWNRGAEELYGWAADRAIGRAAHDLLQTVFPVPLERIVQELLRAGRWEGELLQARQDGSRVVMASRWSLQRDESGAPCAILIINNDITERKRAEQTREALEEQWRAAFENNPTMYFIVDSAGIMVSVNAFGAEQLGYSVDELIGQPALNVFHDLDREAVQKHVQESFGQPGRTMSWEARKIRKDGTVLWVRETANAVLLRKRPVLLVVCEDITEQKRAEEVARRSEKELRDVIQAMPVMAFSNWPDGAADWVNRRWVEYSGLSVEETSGAGWRCALHPDDLDAHVAKWQRSLASGEPFENEARHRSAGGEYRWFLVRAVPLRDEQGRIRKWYGTLTDIEDRKRAEEKLRRSETYLAEAQKLTRTGSWAWDASTEKMLYCSDELFRMFALDPEEDLPSEKIWDRLVPEDRNRVRQVCSEAVRARSAFAEEYRAVLPDGKLKHIHVTGHPIPDAAGEVFEYVGTNVDVTERKRMEEELRGSEARFRTFVDHATDAFILHGEDGTILDVNRHACESLGYSRDELVGVALTAFDPRADTAHMQLIGERLASGEVVTFETRYRRKDGTQFPAEVRVREFRQDSRRLAISFVRDITERERTQQERERLRQLEADLARMNRVSIMGELAASLAHEIKQPMAAAVLNARTCARWLRRDVPDLSEAADAASKMVDDVTRAAAIIDRVRSLYRRDAPQSESVDLNEVVREMASLLGEAGARSSVSIRTELDPGLPPITADRVQLQQVLMNLMLNGVEAMRDRGGELTVTSGRTEDGEFLISVRDCGVGFSPHENERIFETFFTTKPQGTGMGLSISRRIIEAHGGRLWASANVPRGAIFQFTVPAPQDGS